MTRPTLLIFAKPPSIGLAKTRLAKSLGKPAMARRIAFMTLSRTMRAAAAVRGRVILFTTPRKALTTSLGGVWPADLDKCLQRPGNLTDKLNHGLDMAPPGPVLFLGSDAPDITPGLIKRSVQALRTQAVVLGPAADGGFWLFGLNKSHRTRTPFESIRWSSQHTLNDLVANLPPRTRIAYVPELIDIDDADDWQRWTRTRRQP